MLIKKSLGFYSYTKPQIDQVKESLKHSRKYGPSIGLFVIKTDEGNHAFCIVNPFAGKNGKNNSLYSLNYYNYNTNMVKLENDVFDKQGRLISEDYLWKKLRKEMLLCYLIFPINNIRR